MTSEERAREMSVKIYGEKNIHAIREYIRVELAQRDQRERELVGALHQCLNMVDGSGAPPYWDGIRALVSRNAMESKGGR